MADTIFLVVTLRKQVNTAEQAQSLYTMVKERFADQPEIKVTGHFTNHFDQTENP